MTSLKFFDGTQWIEIGAVPGPQGIQGIQGIQGPTGPTGPTAYVAQPGVPGSTSVIWVDTDEPDPDPLAVEAVHLVGAAGEPGFGAGWSNYGTFVGGGFYKDNTGRVFLQGLIKKSSAVVAGETMFTMPVGYRPAGQLLLNCISNTALGRVDVYPDGRVTLQAGNAGWVALDGLSWRAA